MHSSVQKETGKAACQKPVFSFPKLARFEKSNDGGVRVAFTPSPRLLKSEEKEMISQAKTCVGWMRGLWRSRSGI